jgi:hypothetical protein
VWDRTQQQLREHRVRSKSRDARVEKSPLTGRLVAENGDGLTPSHAQRKYRYYVSRNLQAQGSAPSRGSWRLPARELEDRVAAAVREMLDDQASVIEAAQKTDIDSRQIDQVLHSARTLESPSTVRNRTNGCTCRARGAGGTQMRRHGRVDQVAHSLHGKVSGSAFGRGRHHAIVYDSAT